MSRPLIVIANPSAGGGRARKVLAAAREQLSARGAAFTAVETTSAKHALELADEAAERGDTVVALGGDGLVGALAGVLAGRDAPLAVIPGGRGNDFARALGIPRDVAGAVGLALTGDARPLDLGRVDGRPFVGIASVGFDSDANRIANDTKFVKGEPVYLYAAVRALAAWKHAAFTVEIDGRRHEVSGYSVAVANSPVYGGGMRVAPDARLDDGLFDVVMTSASSKLEFVRQLPRVFRGTHVGSRFVEVAHGAEVRLEADRPFSIYADGDEIAQLPATVRIEPGALRVVAPPA